MQLSSTLKIARRLVWAVVAVVVTVLIVRFIAGSPLAWDGGPLDGIDYLPPWSLVGHWCSPARWHAWRCANGVGR